jgi:microcystin degradation protein MlrC
MTLRAVVAMMEHETNTFSPVPTPLSRFGSPDVPTGAEVYRRFKGTGTGIGAFLDVAEAEGMDIVTPIAGNAAPSGHVQKAAYDAMCDAICDAIAAGCDVCFLDLHGAMVTETTEDGEGSLLKRIREMAPDLPIAISLDLHANMTNEIVDNCDVLVGYKTYPHIDMYEAGQHSGQIMVRALKGEIKPVMAWGQRPILAQTLRMGHDDHPMKPMLAMAREAEANGLLAASVFGGFPLADITHAGLSVVTVADGNRVDAEEAADRMLVEAWKEKAEWIFHSDPLPETVARAKEMTDGPIVLLDHADNSASGGTQDTTEVLKEVLDQGLEDVAMFGFCDPDVVAAMEAAGVGSEITVDLGGKVDMHDIGKTGTPLNVTGKVRSLTDGDFVVTVPMGRGITMSMGKSGVLEVGNVQIVVISQHTEPYDLGCFRSVGIEPTNKRYLILKSRIHFRAGFQAIATAEIPCNGVGVTSSDNSLFTFKHVRRPIYPLDPDCPERPNYG